MGLHEFNGASASVSRWTKLARRPVAVASALGLVLVAGALTVGVLPRLPVSSARADDATASLNNLRTGWDPAEPNLAPVSDGGPVGGADFGQIFETQLKGQIYAQPLVVGKVLVVATETNHVYGLNAATGALEWSDDLGKPEPYTATGCNNVTPDIGVTGTPVYDPATGAVYLTAVVDNGPSVSYPHVYLYALNPATGHKLPGWPVDIHGSPVNAPSDSFSPLAERQRSGLLLLDGAIYMGFGSYCDYLPYAGYVAGVNISTRHLALWTDEAGVTNNEGGIWQSGGGLMSDGPGRIFVATGNGVGPPAVSGTTPLQQLGDAVVRLDVGSNGTLSEGDFFSPVDAPELDQTDRDFGSGGPVGLPFGTPSNPDLLFQAGKDGRVFLLDRDNLGGRSQGPGSTDNDVSMTGPFGGLWGHPAAFGPTASVTTTSSDDYLYYVGRSDVMRYLQFGESASGTPTLTDVANTSTAFGYSSGSPVVTSNGDNPSSAVVWEVYSSGSDGAGGSLDAFAAVPPSGCAPTCQMAPLWSAPIGTAAEFTVPVTDAGRVYVGTRDGTVLAFGSPDSAPLTAAPVNFDQVPVGKARVMTTTLTAAAAVTVTGVSLSEPAGSGPFKVRSVAVAGHPATFPISLAAGQQLSARLSYSPAVPGGVTGALQVHTTAANFPLISVSLTGDGTLPGLQASAPGLFFSRVAEGMSVERTVIVTNDSTGVETIRATSAPAAPFTARLPARGTEMGPGQSVAVPVTFDSMTTAPRQSDFSIATTDGHRLTVRLTGTGKPAVSRLTAKPGGLSFGSVRLGSQASKTIVISNAGNLLATITGASALGSPFGTQAEPVRGLPLVPRYQLRVPITFTPTSTGPVTARWVLRWHDAAGTHRLSIPLNGAGAPAASGRRAILPPGGGWTLNGSATMSGGTLSLTSAKTVQAGSAVYAVPESASGLKADFSATIGGDGGLALGLLNARTSSPTALGHSAGGFGLGGLSGVAVTLATGQFAGDPSGNFAGIAVSGPAGLHYVATTTNIPDLALGANRVRVSVSGRRVRLYIAGTQVLTARLGRSQMPAKALIAFTGGTGSAVGSQAITSVSLSAGSQALPAPGGGWSFNGSARMRGSSAELTRAAPDEAGSVVYPAAVPTSGLTVTFTAELSGGSGADGMTFALLDPTTSTATSVGADASGDGFAGLGGVAIGLDTDLAPGVGANSNYVYLAKGTAGSTTLSTLGEAKAIPSLRPGPDSLTVQIVPEGAADLVTVWLDGERIIQQSVTNMPSTALLAFTGGTGTGTDIHLVRDVAISARG